MQVHFFDGEVARRRVAELERVGDSFLLVEAERRHGPFAFADLVPMPGARGRGPSYGLKERHGWRIDPVGAPPDDIAPLLPRAARYGGWIDRAGLWRATAVLLAASAAVVAVVLTTPQWLAPIIPGSVERHLGDALVGDFGGRICHTPDGDAALAKLVGRLDPTPGDLDVGVANFQVVNAAALPGGKVFIFRGLLDDARSPAELAGVLGHEIGHVRERHVMQALLRQLGLSIFLAGADSNVTGALGGALSLGYGREAEREADAHAIEAMRGAAIDPADTAGFFERLGGGALPRERPARAASDGKERPKSRPKFDIEQLGGYMSSHPLSVERRDAFLASRDAERAYLSPLSDAEWTALRRICADDRNVKQGRFF